MSAPLPELWGTLYSPEKIDQQPRNCSNCWLWVTNGQCLGHGPELAVPADAVCGYWSPGTPQSVFRSLGQKPWDPEFSGLDVVPGGTMCGNCRWFESRFSSCAANADGGVPHALVTPLGCCARWEPQR